MADLLEALLAGLVVALDNLAASVALGASGQRRRRWRIAATFAAFGAVAPLLGSLLGGALSARLAGYGAVAGAAVLAALGVWMIVAALRADDLAHSAGRALGGGGLLVLAATLSTDNLLVGFGLGLQGVNTLYLAAASAAFVLAATLVGLTLGAAATGRWRRWPPLAAGLLLLALAAAAAAGWI